MPLGVLFFLHPSLLMIYYSVVGAELVQLDLRGVNSRKRNQPHCRLSWNYYLSHHAPAKKHFYPYRRLGECMPLASHNGRIRWQNPFKTPVTKNVFVTLYINRHDRQIILLYQCSSPATDETSTIDCTVCTVTWCCIAINT